MFVTRSKGLHNVATPGSESHSSGSVRVVSVKLWMHEVCSTKDNKDEIVCDSVFT